MKRLRGIWEAAATSTWDNFRDDKVGKGNCDMLSALGDDLYSFSCRNTFAEVIWWTCSNAKLETHHVGPTLRPLSDRVGGPSLPSLELVRIYGPISSFASSSVACNTDSSVGSTFPPGKLGQFG